MITVITGTNRPKNYTQVFAKHYVDMLTEKQQDAKFLGLENLPLDFAFNNAVFGVENLLLEKIVDEFIVPAQKLIILIPEYNGSYPGVLKTFLDSFFPKQIYGKKAALVGISSGRAGNLRGMDHLTGVLNYLKISVLPNKLPISRIDELITSTTITDDSTLKAINQQLEEFIEF